MKANNYLVTWDDLSTMGLVPKGTPATGNRIATKSFINSNYYVNQSAYPYNTYTSLRCPPYQNIEAGPTNSGTLYYLSTIGDGFFSGFSTCAAACAHSTGGSVTVYWYGTLGLYTYLFLDPDGITYFDGGDLFSINGYCIGTDGSPIVQFNVCETTTTTTTTAAPVTLDWGVGNQSGGQLIILNNVGTQLLNITSNAGSAQSGILTISSTQLPYTIRGAWVSGTGNIIRYRVCDDFGELYLSGAITNVVGSEDYTPSPTPSNAYVYLTANNVTPPICPA